MNSFIEKIRNRHNEIFIAFMGCCFMVLMLYLLPREAKFRYEFTHEGVWQHEDLQAPFDFVLMKNEEEIEAERQEILNENMPIYRLDESVAEIVKNDFQTSLKQQWGIKNTQDDLRERKRRRDSLKLEDNLVLGHSLIDKVLKRGYVKWEEQHLNMEAESDVMVYRGNRAMMLMMGELYTYPSMHNFVYAKLKKEKGIDDELLMDVIEQSLSYNVKFDPVETERVLEENLNNLVIYKGMLSEGEIVIRKGERIDSNKFRRLISLERAFAERNLSREESLYILLGQIFLLGVCLLAFIILIRISHRSLLAAPSKILSILLLISALAIGLKLSGHNESIHHYIAPICIIMLTIRAFYNVVLALFLHIVSVFLLSFLVPNQYEFVFLHFFAGVLLLFGLKGLNKRSHYFNAAILIFFSYSLTYYGINVIQAGDIKGIDWTMYAWFAGNAALSLLAFPLIYVYERVFGLLSEISLLEMADSNNKLLRELNENAPGTFQHSLQVANLAEEAIRKIGGNALLVRVGALYHDIGKMKNPGFFIENQGNGQNPHDNISNIQSSQIIVNHVIHGIELARKHNLPDEIIDFIRSHHGKMRTEYFYRQDVKELGEENVNPRDYQYPGPLPFSKETAVLMMADGVEAASRSLKDVDAQKIDDLVEGLINHQLNSGQFVNADITLKEITWVKSIFKRKLNNIYHIRIEYPK